RAQLLPERLDAFDVGVQINCGRIVLRQLRATGAALFPHDTSIFFAELVGDALHRMDVFTWSASQDEDVIASRRTDDLVKKIDSIARNFTVDRRLRRRRDDR